MIRLDRQRYLRGRQLGLLLLELGLHLLAVGRGGGERGGGGLGLLEALRRRQQQTHIVNHRLLVGRRVRVGEILGGQQRRHAQPLFGHLEGERERLGRVAAAARTAAHVGVGHQLADD
jgi:hypothetical protein